MMVARCLAGDQTGYASLYEAFAPGIYRLCYSLVLNRQDAEDVTQDALLAALRSLDTYRGDGSFASWVQRIAARLYIRRCRYDARFAWMAEPPERAGAEDDSHAPEALLDLDEALLRLSPIERLCVSLCHGAGFTQAEIAEQLQVPLGTAKSHVTRGLHKLRRHLLQDARHNPEDET